MERKNAVETITDANRDARNRHNVRTETEKSDTKRHQTPQHTGSGSEKIRRYRSAVVCLVLLCVLLLTAVIMLSVNLHNMIEDFYIKNKNLTDEITELANKKSNLDNNVKALSAKKEDLIKTQKHLKENMQELLTQKSKMDGWKCHQSSLYYVSSEKKNWIQSRADCTDRGADLIIIDNKEEQDFLKRVSGDSEVWIGLTKVDGTWKWVNESTGTQPGFWASRKPSDSSGNENCAVNLSSGFADYSCVTKKFKWICEKNNLKN
ncbi:hepatic lectin-like [Puntigrus tetrazona]|uniref:hepatic lectin-like n=1 Tax=Puntigrus tetrazona TaxID=1606681 RepID=UPI001C8A68F5|nr:hepatic lectin-like [Puntigrus tetrazona]